MQRLLKAERSASDAVLSPFAGGLCACRKVSCYFDLIAIACVGVRACQGVVAKLMSDGCDTMYGWPLNIYRADFQIQPWIAACWPLSDRHKWQRELCCGEPWHEVWGESFFMACTNWQAFRVLGLGIAFAELTICYEAFGRTDEHAAACINSTNSGTSISLIVLFRVHCGLWQPSLECS